MKRGLRIQNPRPLKIIRSNSPGILELGSAQPWETGGSAQEGAVLSQGGGWMGFLGNDRVKIFDT